MYKKTLSVIIYFFVLVNALLYSSESDVRIIHFPICAFYAVSLYSLPSYAIVIHMQFSCIPHFLIIMPSFARNYSYIRSLVSIQIFKYVNTRTRLGLYYFIKERMFKRHNFLCRFIHALFFSYF